MGDLEGEGGRGLALEGDSAMFGFVILDGEVDGARAAVDGNEQVAFAPVAVTHLQPGQVLNVDVHEAEVVIAERSLAFGGASGRGWAFDSGLRL